MSWCLQSLEKANLGSLIYLKKGLNSFGRSVNSDIKITSPNVSRSHGYIIIQDDKARIADLQSFNGIFISDFKILPNRELELKDGDKLGIGINPTLPYEDNSEAEKCIFNIVRQSTPQINNDKELREAATTNISPHKEKVSQQEEEKTSGVNNSTPPMEHRLTMSAETFQTVPLMNDEMHCQQIQKDCNDEEMIQNDEEDLYLIPGHKLEHLEEAVNSNKNINEPDENSNSENNSLAINEISQIGDVFSVHSDNSNEAGIINCNNKEDEDIFSIHSDGSKSPVEHHKEDDYPMECEENSFSNLNYSQCDDDVIILDDEDENEEEHDFKHPLIKKEVFETLDLTIEEDDDENICVESGLAQLFGFNNQDVNLEENHHISPLEGDLISSLLSQREEDSVQPKQIMDIDRINNLKRKKYVDDYDEENEEEDISKRTRISNDNVPESTPDHLSFTSQNVERPKRQPVKGKVKLSPLKRGVRKNNKKIMTPPKVNKRIKDMRRKKLKEIAIKDKMMKENCNTIVPEVNNKINENQQCEGDPHKYPTDVVENGRINDVSLVDILPSDKNLKHIKNTDKNRSAVLIEAIPIKKKRGRKPKETARAPSPLSKLPPTVNIVAPPVEASSSKKTVRFNEDCLYQVKFFTPEIRERPVIPINQHDVIQQACKWNPKWIQECAVLTGLPPLLENTLNFDYAAITPTVKDNYANFKDYERTMYPLLIYELWDSIIKSSQQQRTTFVANVNDSIPLPPSGINHLAMESLIIQLLAGEGVAPRKGDLIIVKTQAGDQSRAVWTGFGFVTETMRQTKLQHTMDPIVQKLYHESKANFKGSKQVNCLAMKILIRQRKVNCLSPGSLLTVEVLMNINKDLRLFMSMTKVLRSPLEYILMNPQKAVIDEEIVIDPKKNMFNMNEEQVRAIQYCKQMAFREEESITIIHGPPGTGKSVTITNLVQEIVKENLNRRRDKKRVRVLLCAPSNYAVDELVCKLMDIRESLPSAERFKLVRCGKFESMCPKARLVSLISLSQKRLDQLSNDKEFAKKYLSDLCEKEKFLTSQVEQVAAYCSQKVLKEVMDLRRHIKDVQDFLDKKGDKRVPERLMAFIEKELLYRCDIVATTLSSATSFISEAFVDKDGKSIKPFNCCIVDEASQAIELQTLSPILLSVDKFILVGDHKQLAPVVTSPQAKECGLDRSLFERLLRCWKDKSDAPIFPLVKQYRMHPEILKFPNKTFYSGTLKSDESASTNNSPLKPYLVLNHPHQQLQSDERNEDEAIIVKRLVQLILQRDDYKDCRIGIITPYQAQKIHFCHLLDSMGIKRDGKVSVNTIDSAQGQEKEVIIISLVKTSGVGFLNDPNRLNVALTRAKHSLFIVANFCSLKNCNIWRDLKNDARKRHVLKSVDASISDSKLCDLIFKRS